MPTVVDLMKEALEIQKRTSQFIEKMAEFEQRSQRSSQTLDIADVMKTAELYPIEGHWLRDVKNVEKVASYLSALLMVSVQGVDGEVKSSLLLYPCRIAVALDPETRPDMALCLKNALKVDQDGAQIQRFVADLTSEGLCSEFVLDALMMSQTYDVTNGKKVEFILELAAMMGLNELLIKDLAAIVLASVAHAELFRKTKETLPVSQRLLGVIKNCPEVAIVSNEFAVLVGDSSYLLRKIQKIGKDAICSFKDLKEVVFYKMTFDDDFWKTHSIAFKNIRRCVFFRCKFIGFESGVFDFNSIGDVIISHCDFLCCTNGTGLAFGCRTDNSIDPESGVLADVKNVSRLVISDSRFKNCHILLNIGTPAAVSDVPLYHKHYRNYDSDTLTYRSTYNEYETSFGSLFKGSDAYLFKIKRQGTAVLSSRNKLDRSSLLCNTGALDVIDGDCELTYLVEKLEEMLDS